MSYVEPCVVGEVSQELRASPPTRWQVLAAERSGENAADRMQASRPACRGGRPEWSAADGRLNAGTSIGNPFWIVCGLMRFESARTETDSTASQNDVSSGGFKGFVFTHTDLTNDISLVSRAAGIAFDSWMLYGPTHRPLGVLLYRLSNARVKIMLPLTFAISFITLVGLCVV